jgi:predicted porin
MNTIKKTLCGAIAVAAGICSGAASAQVTIYGVYDTGIEYVTNSNAAGDAMLRMPNITGATPSRLGFRGTEDLSGDLKTVFVLETGFDPGAGSLGQGGRLFGREAWVGLKNTNGTLMLGRQYSMLSTSLQKADFIGPSIHSARNAEPYISNARHDNSVGYLGTFSNVTAGATYSFGRDTSSAGGAGGSNCAGEVAGNSKACRQATAMLGYDTDSFGVAGAYDIMYGNTGATNISGPANPLIKSFYYDERYVLDGYAKFGATKIGLGWIDRRTHAAKQTGTQLSFLGVTYASEGNWVLDGQISRYKVKNAIDSTSTLLVARGTYNFSKRSAAYLSMGYIQNDNLAANPVDNGGAVGKPGMDQTGVMAGIRYTF